ncbi:tetratricopeptide repeat protein [Sphaerisporangium aureirubrum]|uniref:Tetratricopeptide repeat protein n=1 Tax=Sphaerisporangium aureirubrum TaxID=1544736 RepID=A0ABW1NGG8_9ACTN
MSTDERVERARLLYERALFGGETAALAEADRELDAVEAGLAPARGRAAPDRELDAAEADLALARGRLVHARAMESGQEDPGELVLFERAAGLYRALGDMRGEAEAVGWAGIFHQVIRRDDHTAVPLLERSLALATRAGDALTMSYALRHLGFAEHMAGRLDPARAHLEESVRLRREAGFLPGVAANLVGLAYIASAQGRRADALSMIEEAAAIAGSEKALGIMRWVEEARTQLQG